jgi:integrase
MSTLQLVKTATPGVYKRGGRYVVTYTDLSGKRRKQFAKTYKEATRLKAQLRADVDRGEWREQSRARFIDYLCEWITTYKGRSSRGIRRETLAAYAGLLGLDRDEAGDWGPSDPPRAAVKFFGRTRLTEITPPQVKQYAESLSGQGLKPSSVRKTLAPLRVLFATAVEDGLIRSNPAAGVRVVKAADDTEGDMPKVKALTPAQVDALIAATPVEWRLFVTFLAETGLRIGEAIALQWKHIDLGSQRVLVRRRFYKGSFGPPKSRYGCREVPIGQPLAQALWTLRGGRDDDALVFTTCTGRIIDAHNLRNRILKPAAADAGIGEWVETPRGRRAESWIGFHTLRHSCATTLFVMGFNAKQVQVWLGHHSATFTLDTYVHLLSEDLPASPFDRAFGFSDDARGGEALAEHA